MFAIFRASPDKDLAQIGESHLQRDLSQEDRDVLSKAARKVSVHATMGSLLGLGLGILAAYRIHANRVALYNAFRMVSKPSEIVFADGRREILPDLDPYLRPTRLSDAATYGAFGLGGLFLGGETGFLTGSASAATLVARDPERQKRIEHAFRRFQVDVMKREIDLLEGEDKDADRGEGAWERMKERAGGLASSLRG